MRVVQVHGRRPVENNIFAFYQLDGVQGVERTEAAKAFVDTFVRRERAAGKMKANFIVRPIFWNIKVKLPNSVIQISFDRLVKLEMEIELGKNIFFVTLFVCNLILSDLQRKVY